MKAWTTIEGSPLPQGVAWVEEEQAYNFAIYSKHAESVTLLTYKEDDVLNPVFSYSLDYLKNKSGRIWHCRIPKARMKGAAYYAYSIGLKEPD